MFRNRKISISAVVQGYNAFPVFACSTHAGRAIFIVVRSVTYDFDIIRSLQKGWDAAMLFAEDVDGKYGGFFAGMPKKDNISPFAQLA